MPGLSRYPYCYEVPIPPHMQEPKSISVAVGGIVGYGWFTGLELGGLVVGAEDAGFRFSPGKALDDVLVTPIVLNQKVLR